MTDLYICQSCHQTTKEPAVFEEDHGLRDGGLSEYLACCPYCGGEIEPAETCENCGNVYGISTRYMTDVCSEKCWDAMSDKWANEHAPKPLNMVEFATGLFMPKRGEAK